MILPWWAWVLGWVFILAPVAAVLVGRMLARRDRQVPREHDRTP